MTKIREILKNNPAFNTKFIFISATISNKQKMVNLRNTFTKVCKISVPKNMFPVKDQDIAINKEMTQRSNKRISGKSEWNWPVHKTLSKNIIDLWDPVPDRSCLFWCFLVDIDKACTVSNCGMIQHKLNQYILHHKKLYPFLYGTLYNKGMGIKPL